jgi:hypothetical protein
MCCIQESCLLPPAKMFGEICGVRFFGGEKGANAISWGDLADTSAPRAEPPRAEPPRPGPARTR